MQEGLTTIIPEDTTFKIYKGRNNPFRIRLFRNGRPLTLAEMQEITKVSFLYNNVEMTNSLDHASYWDMTSFIANAQVGFDFGLLNFTAGTDTEAEFIVYSADYPVGKVWATVSVEIVEDALSTAPLVDPLEELTLRDIVGITDDMATNIEVIATPGNWKLFYSDGDGAIQTLDMDTNGYLHIKDSEAPEVDIPEGMSSTVYDPQGIFDDAFSMANMTEAADAKVLTAAERAKIANTNSEAPLDVLDADYNMTAADLNRRSIRLIATVDRDINLPAGAAAINGKRQTFIQAGAGRVILNAETGDTLVSTGEDQILSGSLFAAITLEYMHATRTWIGISALGKWGTPT